MIFASNVKISSPLPITHKADVDFNGLQFNYVVGLMYPSTAALNNTMIVPPPISAQPAFPSGGLH